MLAQDFWNTDLGFIMASFLVCRGMSFHCREVCTHVRKTNRGTLLPQAWDVFFRVLIADVLVRFWGIALKVWFGPAR